MNETSDLLYEKQVYLIALSKCHVILNSKYPNAMLQKCVEFSMTSLQ